MSIDCKISYVSELLHCLLLFCVLWNHQPAAVCADEILSSLFSRTLLSSVCQTVLILFLRVLQMSAAEAKRNKIVAALEKEQKRKEAAQAVQASGALPLPALPSSQEGYVSCAERQNGQVRARLHSQLQATLHGYKPGHPGEATSDRRIQKLQKQAEEAEKAAEAEVC
jgi:hypothetical protein